MDDKVIELDYYLVMEDVEKINELRKNLKLYLVGSRFLEVPEFDLWNFIVRQFFMVPRVELAEKEKWEDAFF